MNTTVNRTDVVAFAASVVTPVVIARYGGEIADFLRIDVLMGIGIVATLVALITKEYVRRAPRAARQPVALRAVGDVIVRTEAAELAVLPNDEDTRAAA
jgi:hypothetical protein